jgi:hypothetical protein
MTRILDLQVAAYGRSGGPQQPGVADRASVESAIDVGVALFDAARNEVRRWQRDTTDWDAAPTIEQARAYDRLYRELHAALARLLPLVATLEKAATPPENADRLHAALRELEGIVCFDLDRVVRADQAFRAGRTTRTMAEVKDAFHRRVGE